MSLAGLIEDITGVPVAALTDVGRSPYKSLNERSVAQRMSWAANRDTPKVPEDRACSLLGIFYIQMSPLDGEGERASMRLQEEILRRIPDQTIFAWGPVYPESFPMRTGSPHPGPPKTPFWSRSKKTAPALPMHIPLDEGGPHFGFITGGSSSIFAASPRDFAAVGKAACVSHKIFLDILARYCELSAEKYTLIPYGVRANFPRNIMPLANCFNPYKACFESSPAVMPLRLCSIGREMPHTGVSIESSSLSV